MKNNTLKIRLYNIAVIIFGLITTIMLMNEKSEQAYGYQYLFLVPFLYTIFYSLGRLKKMPLNDIPIVAFRVLILLRYVIMPFLMCISNNYTAAFYDHTIKTTEHQRIVATVLYILEMIAVFSVTEYELHHKLKWILLNKDQKQEQTKALQSWCISSHSFVLWCAAFIGIGGCIIYPAIRNRMYFLIASEDVESVAMSFIPSLFYEFSKLVPIFVSVICCQEILKKRGLSSNNNLGYSFILLICCFLYVAIRWSSNRMSIIRSALVCMSVLFLLYPKRAKTITLIFGSLTAAVFITVTSFKWFDQTSGNMDMSVYSETFGLNEIVLYLQMYFNGIDELAYAVRLKESAEITFRTFINDTFRNVVFLNQFIKGGDAVNTSQLYNWSINGIDSRLGLIIPMSGHAIMHLGYWFSWVYSCICTKLLFVSVRKRNTSKNFTNYLLWMLLAIEFGCFQGYNYSLIIANVCNNVALLIIMVKLSKKFILRGR